MHERDYLYNLYREHLYKRKEVPSRIGFRKAPADRELYSLEYLCRQVANSISQEKLEQHIRYLSSLYPNVTGKPAKYNESFSISTRQLNQTRGTKDYKHIHGKGYQSWN